MGIRVRPIAYDSLGVRSMATLIDTDDLTIFIDPAASLAPKRFGLPPHEEELRRLDELRKRIALEAKKADVIVITHYHYDHHDPRGAVDLEIYNNKTVIIKNPRNKINVSQRIRSSRFLKALGKRPKEIVVGDGKEFRFGNTRVVLSPPVMHGHDARLGYVIMVYIEHGGESVLFTSDVEGFLDEVSVRFASRLRPDIVLADGPPTYLAGHKVPANIVEKSLENTSRALCDSEPVLALDHHLIRDPGYLKYYEALLERCPALRVTEASRLAGLDPDPLESRRRELYGVNR